MQLVLEQTTKKYIKEENNSITIQTDMKQYHYESETEKMNHKKEIWFGSYSKWQRIEN